MKKISAIFVMYLIGYQLHAQCNFTVDAGPDKWVCNPGEIVQLNGKLMGGPILSFEWEPPTGLSNPTSLTTDAQVFSRTEYILKAKGKTTQNLVFNGDFELGKVGFGTDYAVGTMSCYGFGYLDCEGTFDVITNPFLGHSAWAMCNDHTSGSGNMMVLNGAPSLQNVWCQTVAVMPGMDYEISAWITSVSPASPAQLTFSMNGDLLGNFNSSGSTCSWENFTQIWNSGGSASVQICIVNQNTNTGGNDFAIDDISLIKICEVTDTVVVDVIEIIGIIKDPPIATCDNPKFKLDAIGSSAGRGWTYEWTTVGGIILSGGNSLTPEVLGPGTYTLKICSPIIPTCCKSFSVEVMGNIKEPDLRLEVFDSLGCGKNVVTILSSTTSLNNITYLWTGPNGFMSFDQHAVVMDSGYYYLTIVDEYNCKRSDSIKVYEKDGNPRLQINYNNINCIEDTAHIKVISSIKGSSYSWKGPKGNTFTDSSFVTIDTGLFILTTMTPAGCVKVDTVHIKEDKRLANLSVGLDTITCINKSVDITLQSDKKAKHISWTGPNNFNKKDTLQVNTTDAGSYEVFVELDNGCISTIKFDLHADTLAPALSVFTDTITCNKSFADLKAISGTTSVNYQWTGPNQFYKQTDTCSTNQTGVYTCIITSANGCVNSASLTVSNDTLSPVYTLQADTLNCKNSTSVIQFIGDSTNITAKWSGPNNFSSQSKSNSTTQSGLYQITATNPKNGCTRTQTITVIEDKLTPEITAKSDTLTCAQDSLSIQALISQLTGSYKWNGPNGFSSSVLQPFITIPGTYRLIATNPNFCSDTFDVEIFQDNRKPDLSLSPDTINCTKRSIAITAQSSFSNLNYNWSGPGNFNSSSQTINVSSGGTYTITITTADLCKTESTVQISVDTIAPIATPIIDTLNCKKTSIALDFNSSSNISNILWTGPNNFNSNAKSPNITQGGNYILTIGSANTCLTRYNINILQDTLKPSLIANSDTITCSKTQARLQASTNPTNAILEWKINQTVVGTNPLLITNQAGTYFLTASLANGCTTQIPIQVDVDTLKPFVRINADTITCKFPIAVLEVNANPNYKYIWNTNNTGFQLNTSNAGTYTCTVTGTNDCQTILTTQVSIDTIAPNIILSADSIDCLKTIANVSATGDVQFPIIWKNTSGTIISQNRQFTTFDAGIFTATITNPKNGCITQKDVEVKKDNLIIADVELDLDQPVCGAEIGRMRITKITGGHNRIEFAFDIQGPYQTTQEFSQLKEGRYTLYVRDEKGCTFQKQFDIAAEEQISTDIGPQLDLILGDSSTLNLHIIPDVRLVRSISWDPVRYLSCSDCEDPKVKPLETTFYTVTVVDTNGCVSTSTIRVYVENPKVWIPNVFSPNDDGINDEVIIKAQKADVTEIVTFQIFDRWGELVYVDKNFKPNDKAHSWNGVFRNKKLQPGVYVYVADVKLSNGLSWILKGDITLMH